MSVRVLAFLRANVSACLRGERCLVQCDVVWCGVLFWLGFVGLSRVVCRGAVSDVMRYRCCSVVWFGVRCLAEPALNEHVLPRCREGRGASKTETGPSRCECRQGTRGAKLSRGRCGSASEWRFQ